MADIWGLECYEAILWKETKGLAVEGNLNPELLNLSFRAHIKTRDPTNKGRGQICVMDEAGSMTSIRKLFV